MSFAALQKYLLLDQMVVYKSDTIPSIYTRINNYQKLNKLKERSPAKPFILLAGSFKMLLLFSKIPISLFDKAKQISATPYMTVIYEASTYLKKEFSWPYQTVAIRIPILKELQKMIEAMGEPIISTSYELQYRNNKNLVFINGWDEDNRGEASKIYYLQEGRYIR